MKEQNEEAVGRVLSGLSARGAPAELQKLSPQGRCRSVASGPGCLPESRSGPR
jgi:hypothetical protein